MLLEQTISKMRSLRLKSMAESLEKRLDRGDHRDLSAQEFIGLLIDDEYTARENRKLSKSLGRAKFGPTNACMEDIKYTSSRNLIKSDILEFTKPQWIENGKNIIFTGPTGTGKTYLSEAIGRQACYMGFTCQKKRYKNLFEEIKMARGIGQYLKYMEKLERIQVLIIDDFLMQEISDYEATDLLEIIEARNGSLNTIVTTQFPVSKWHEKLKNYTIADAICDRLVNSSEIYNLKGESLRKGGLKNKKEMTSGKK